MLTKPGAAAAASGVSRLKKTITTGAISELAESRLKPSAGRHKDSVTRAVSVTWFAKVPAECLLSPLQHSRVLPAVALTGRCALHRLHPTSQGHEVKRDAGWF